MAHDRNQTLSDTAAKSEPIGFTIRIDETSTVVESHDEDTVLEALLRAGCGIPYECSAGGCGSCKVTLLDGELGEILDNPPGLKDRDRRKGKRLACVSRPRSDCRISVQFDSAYEPKIRPSRQIAHFVSRTFLTPDLAEFRFQSESSADFLPGQYARLAIPGVSGTRSYSMSNTANAEGLWEFQIKRVPGGSASEVLFADPPADLTVSIDAPYSIAYLPENQMKSIVCIAGGSGLAPMISILRGLAERGAPRPRASLYYGARRISDVVDPNYLAGIPGFNPAAQYIPVVSDSNEFGRWEGAKGLLHDHLAEALSEACTDFDYYIAGPPPMVDAVRRLLVLEKKVPVQRLHYDRFY